MVTVLALLGVLVVLFVAAVLSTREGPVMADAPQDAADLDLPDGPLQPEDVHGLRFGLAPRGYRMSEVDAVLARLAAELTDRDRRIGLLEAAVEGSPGVREAGTDDLPLGDGLPAGAPEQPAGGASAVSLGKAGAHEAAAAPRPPVDGLSAAAVLPLADPVSAVATGPSAWSPSVAPPVDAVPLAPIAEDGAPDVSDDAPGPGGDRPPRP